MTPFFFFLFAVFLLIGCSNAAISGRYDIHGNYIQSEHEKMQGTPQCCWINTCDSTGCFDSLQCGYKCSTGNYRPASYGPTPGYKRKEFYHDYQCVFDQCEKFKITCNHCPLPELNPDFSLYTIRKDCRHCYYQ